ncbi:hypothetical protein [Sabulicella glaciei]|uniref:Uncharacterized protein n=1 Tax=Sabulicella glaciei TaxID=2984948 RepID=A0ABT3NTZ6_9PROT|nr:hypothetical protein [Roseococcus sp. MDT2-1-1]MCW8085029.1 hypothetical protein [Roseococcus sp. MDT2-1-1]
MSTHNAFQTPDARRDERGDSWMAGHGNARRHRLATGAAGPHRKLAIAFASALVLMSGLAIAAPALEYGPEAEARFLGRCTGNCAPAALCRDLMERLQESLGYEVFLQLVDGGPEGFGRVPEERMASAAAESRPDVHH